MTEHERRDAAIGMLHRMIVYVHAEAVRLRVMDVALLLDRAEDVVTTFAPTASNRPGPTPSCLEINRGDH